MSSVSFDNETSESDVDVESTWQAEVERRLDAADRGEAQFEAWDVVQERISTRLRDMRR